MPIKILGLIRNTPQCRSLLINSLPINARSIIIDTTLIRIDLNWLESIGNDRYWDRCHNFDQYWSALGNYPGSPTYWKLLTIHMNKYEWDTCTFNLLLSYFSQWGSVMQCIISIPFMIPIKIDYFMFRCRCVPGISWSCIHDLTISQFHLFLVHLFYLHTKTNIVGWTSLRNDNDHSWNEGY